MNHIYAKSIFKAVQALPSRDRRLVHRIVEFESDIENFLIAVKQKGSKDKTQTVEEMFPTTYGISLDILRKVINTGDIKHVIQGLNPPYYEIMTPLYEGDVALIRSRLRQHIYNLAKSERAKNDFSFNVVMAYLIFSEIEKDDLVGISWGKTQCIAKEDILKYLVIPHLV